MQQLTVQVQQTEKLKLSTIWRRAACELKQVRGQYGNPKEKTACAVGAVIYYLSHGQTCGLISPDEWEQLAPLLDPWYDKDPDPASSIFYLNDHKLWSFERFAEEAERRGL